MTLKGERAMDRKKGNLKILEISEIKEAFEYQKEKTGWTFYNEREFMENLLQMRFNFLIAVYALFLNALFLSKNTKMIILIIGLIIVFIMGLTVYRIYKKLIIILRIIHKLGEQHVFSIVDKEIRSHKTGFIGVNEFIGITIPVLLVSSFIVGIILFHCGILKFK
jgi:hypothetical protein